MKTIYSFILISLMPMISVAQLRVDSVGVVKVDNKLIVADSVNNSTALALTKALVPFITNKAAEIVVGVDETSYLEGTNAIGLSATAGGGGKNFGIIGNLFSSDIKGAGILGTRGTPHGLSLSKSYAGYFDGPVEVTSYLDAALTDCVPKSTANNGDTSWNALSILNCLVPVYWDEHVRQQNSRESDDEFEYQEISSENNREQDRLITRKHYNIKYNSIPSPDIDFLVYNSTTQFGIDYRQLVPVLVKAVKELKGQLDSLSNRNFGESETMSRGTTSSLESGYSENIMPSMSQNIPNPFSERTDIAITLPESVRKAVLYIYDMTGKQLEQHEVAGRGETTMTIYADQMSNGMYIYALVADGKVITSRKMIVAK